MLSGVTGLAPKPPGASGLVWCSVALITTTCLYRLFLKFSVSPADLSSQGLDSLTSEIRANVDMQWELVVALVVIGNTDQVINV